MQLPNYLNFSNLYWEQNTAWSLGVWTASQARSQGCSIAVCLETKHQVDGFVSIDPLESTGLKTTENKVLQSVPATQVTYDKNTIKSASKFFLRRT